IVRGAEERGLAFGGAEDFEALTGKGVKGRVDGREVAHGNRAMMEMLGLDIAGLEAEAEARRREGATAMFVAVDRAPAGLVAVADPIKATTAEAVRQLHADGLRLVMLTGDSRTTAEAVAATLGIDEVVADV